MHRIQVARRVALVVALASAAEAQNAAPAGKLSFDLSPAIIDAKSGTGSTLGADYKLKGGRTLKRFDTVDTGATLLVNATVAELALAYEAKGTVTAAASRNPRNFLEFGVELRALRSGTAGVVLGGPFLKGEADQRFVNKQAVVGFSGTLGKRNIFARNDYLGVTFGYGRVDPTGDTERAKAVGADHLAGYRRWNAEGLFMIPVSHGTIQTLELNARLFVEPNAPAAVQDADLDQHALGTIRLGFKNDLYVSYSAGTLPFDRKSDNVMALGFAFKLK